ncbi:MAG: YciI family protein [Pseudomonadota bacterium]
MWFSIVSEDVPNSTELRLQHRPAHLARLQAMQSEGRLLVAGPNPQTDEAEPSSPAFSGSLVILDFESIADAQAWAEADPFYLNGVYSTTTVKPYKLVLAASAVDS